MVDLETSRKRGGDGTTITGQFAQTQRANQALPWGVPKRLPFGPLQMRHDVASDAPLHRRAHRQRGEKRHLRLLLPCGGAESWRRCLCRGPRSGNRGGVPITPNKSQGGLVSVTLPESTWSPRTSPFSVTQTSSSSGCSPVLGFFGSVTLAERAKKQSN